MPSCTSALLPYCNILRPFEGRPPKHHVHATYRIEPRDGLKPRKTRNKKKKLRFSRLGPRPSDVITGLSMRSLAQPVSPGLQVPQCLGFCKKKTRIRTCTVYLQYVSTYMRLQVIGKSEELAYCMHGFSPALQTISGSVCRRVQQTHQHQL